MLCRNACCIKIRNPTGSHCDVPKAGTLRCSAYGLQKSKYFSSSADAKYFLSHLGHEHECCVLKPAALYTALCLPALHLNITTKLYGVCESL